jgi:hypothetical protein
VDADKLKEIVEKHNAWLLGKPEGECANLRDADLRDADLRGANLRGADLRDADLWGAYLQDADLWGAYLQDADLRGANLRGANLRDADLRDADLWGAYLWGAYLQGAKGIIPERVTPLLMLLDQDGKIRAYKIVNENNEGIYKGGLKYEIGATLEVEDANTDPNEQCAEGINLCTLDWCLKEYREGYKVLICEFEAKDIACIPTATDGKFRCHRVTVVGEKDISELVK